MKALIKKIYSKINTIASTRRCEARNGDKMQFPCRFSSTTEIGNNCHFNGMSISGSGRVIIGDNFHSGKNIRILTTFHYFDNFNFDHR